MNLQISASRPESWWSDRQSGTKPFLRIAEIGLTPTGRVGRRTGGQVAFAEAFQGCLGACHCKDLPPLLVSATDCENSNPKIFCDGHLRNREVILIDQSQMAFTLWQAASQVLP